VFIARFIYIIVLCLMIGGWEHGNYVPAPALANGYTLNTYSSNFSPSKIDSGHTYASGFQWYDFNFLGYSDVVSYTTGPGHITISQTQNNGNAGIASAGQNGLGTWVGTAFGGGAYIQAIIKFDPSSINTANGWPAFWSMSIEHLKSSTSAATQWPGQATGYMHFVELDEFEAYAPDAIGALHDWYGTYQIGGTCGDDILCNVQSAPWSTLLTNQNWNVYQTVGVLWIPATVSTNGSATWYLNGVQVGQQTWTQYTTQPPPPGGGATWTFGLIDQQHIVLILGTGTSPPITVQSVNVWQASAAGNLVQ
jgi:hypothetical protein